MLKPFDHLLVHECTNFMEREKRETVNVFVSGQYMLKIMQLFYFAVN